MKKYLKGEIVMKMRIKKEGLLGKILRWLFDKDLLRNKVVALVIMLLGALTMIISHGDCTAFVLTILIGLPVLFAKENLIDD